MKQRKVTLKINNKIRILIASLILGSVIYSGCQKEKDTPFVDTTSVDTTSVDTSGQDSSNPIRPAYISKIKNAKWDSTWVSDAVLWEYHYFDTLFDVAQSITVFDVDLTNPNLTIKLPYANKGSFLKTSEGGDNVGAVAAINGSYFDTKIGGSTVFFKSEGQVITTTKSGFTFYRENTGFAMDKEGNASIVKRPASGWEKFGVYSNLLASGPLLVYEGKVVDQLEYSFNTDRNPRTAVGLTEGKHLIAVVVDGRTKTGGMTTEQLAKLLKVLGCQTAMNLDGGGSSTAWVKGRGVVNYPSDNKKFDHNGERAVATIIAFVME